MIKANVTTSISRRFEAFVVKLFRAHKYIVRIEKEASDNGRDFVIVSPDGRTAIAQLKFYNSIGISADILLNAAETLLETFPFDRQHSAALVVNCRIERNTRARLAEFGNFVVYDYDSLSAMAELDEELAAEWSDLVRDAFAFRNEPIPEAEEFDGDPAAWPPFVPQKPRRRRINKPGRDICVKLRGVRAGGGQAARDYELACEEAVKYLFDGDFSGWSPQMSSSGRLHRYDLIARISSRSDFWLSLISDYRARYVIFEFKNYGKHITQREIYTTEKYLLPIAMRSMAIIFARCGANSNAKTVMGGALREAGKVILCASTSDVCEMLHMKDRGDDPAVVVRRLIDEMLMTLER